MANLKFPLTLAVILTADFYAWHQGWEGLGAVGVICAACWFMFGDESKGKM